MKQNYLPSSNLSFAPNIWTSLLLLFLFFSGPSLSARSIDTENTSDHLPAFVCNTFLEVALGVDCETEITAYDILEGEADNCCDNYIVELFYDEARTQLVPTSPVLTSSEVDLSIYVILTDPVTTNNCDGTSLMVVDNLIPDLSCNAVQQIDCNASSDPGPTLPFPVEPTVNVIGNSQPYILLDFDPCGPATLTYSDLFENGVCGTDDFLNRIIRTWTAEDASGNTTSCNDTIEINRPLVTDVMIPVNLDGMGAPHLDCNDVDNDGINDSIDPLVLVDANGHPHPDVSGYPTLNGSPINDALACGLLLDYEDQAIQLCNASTLYLRTWTIVTWCPTSLVETGTQIIKVIDDIAPVISCPEDVTVSAGQNDCTASVIIPVPTITDECSGTATYTVTANQGTLLNNTLFNLPVGDTEVTYTAIDDCENTSTCSFTITVEDQVPPVTVCELLHTVGITLIEPTLVNAEVFDDGSADNCSASLTYEVRRMDNPNCALDDATPFGPSAPFFCCDVGGDNVMVELRVTDASGNTNSCMVEVEVQDQLNPAITCPVDKILPCDGDTSVANTGMAIASDNCGYVISYSDQGSIGSCGSGTIFRTWVATDPGGRTASCVQRIDLGDSDPFVITDTECWQSTTGHTTTDGIEWPCDLSLSSCGTGLHPDSLANNPNVNAFDVRPRLFPNACINNMVAVAFEDEELDFPGTCVKILRTWSVYNWCGANPSVPVASYVQLIEIPSSDAPVFNSTCDDIIIFGGIPNPNNTVSINLMIDATDDCTPADELSYSYRIDLGANGSLDFVGSGNDASADYPINIHRIFWQVEDACGNVTNCDYRFNIVPGEPSYAIVSGGIENEEGEEVEQVHIMVDSDDMNEEEMTDNNGNYTFNLPIAQNYTVTPERNDNHLNGVSTYDLVLITQHVLNIEPLSTPYKMIAADVNRSGHISTLDAVALRKLILFIDDEFEDNTSWRFIDATYVFANPQNPFANSFPEFYTVNDLSSDEVADFVAVKTGDVNCSANTSGLLGAGEARNQEKPWTLTTQNQILEAGKTYHLAIQSEASKTLEGFQFTLAFDPSVLSALQLAPADLPAMGSANFGYRFAEQGFITGSWNRANHSIKNENTTVFHLTFQAQKAGILSDFLQINSRYTKAEAYLGGITYPIELSFNETLNDVVTPSFTLYQNRPNPFKANTLILFQTETASAGTLTIYDISGRAVRSFQQDFAAGYNEISVDRSELGGHGVYYYQLEIDSHSAIKKMVLIE